MCLISWGTFSYDSLRVNLDRVIFHPHGLRGLHFLGSFDGSSRSEERFMFQDSCTERRWLLWKNSIWCSNDLSYTHYGWFQHKNWLRDSLMGSSTSFNHQRDDICAFVQPGKTKCDWRKWAGCWGRLKFCDYLVKLFKYVCKRTFEKSFQPKSEAHLGDGDAILFHRELPHMNRITWQLRVSLREVISLPDRSDCKLGPEDASIVCYHSNGNFLGMREK